MLADHSQRSTKIRRLGTPTTSTGWRFLEENSLQRRAICLEKIYVDGLVWLGFWKICLKRSTFFLEIYQGQGTKIGLPEI